MLDEIISYHYYMVEILLGMIVLNAIVPSLLRGNLQKMVFWTRVGYFGFWMFWSMNIFAGLIVFMFTGRELTLSVILMILASVALAVADAYRAIGNKRRWMQGIDAIRFSLGILGMEAAVIIAVSLYAIKVH